MIKLFLEWRINRLKKQRDELSRQMSLSEQGFTHDCDGSPLVYRAVDGWAVLEDKIYKLETKLNEVTE